MVNLGLSNDISLCFSLGGRGGGERGGEERGGEERGGEGGGVFHFSLDGPYLGRVLGQLLCCYPKMRDVSQQEWRRLVKGLEREEGREEETKEKGFLRGFEVDMMMRYEFGDLEGRFARGVETEKTKERMKEVCGMEFLEGVGDDDLGRFMRYYKESGFFE